MPIERKRARRERGEVRVETRDSRVIGYLTELEEEGKIRKELTGGGEWIVSWQKARPRIADR